MGYYSTSTIPTATPLTTDQPGTAEPRLRTGLQRAKVTPRTSLCPDSTAATRSLIFAIGWFLITYGNCPVRTCKVFWDLCWEDGPTTASGPSRAVRTGNPTDRLPRS